MGVTGGCRTAGLVAARHVHSYPYLSIHAAVICCSVPFPALNCVAENSMPSQIVKSFPSGYHLSCLYLLQSSWALSSSLNPSGCLGHQSASGGAATKTRPGSIWYDLFMSLSMFCLPQALASGASISFTSALYCFPTLHPGLCLFSV